MPPDRSVKIVTAHKNGKEILVKYSVKFDEDDDETEEKVFPHYHFYNVVKGKQEGAPIVVDSTYLQFIKPSKRENYAPIFVGTQKSLVQFFVKNRNLVFDPFDPLREDKSRAFPLQEKDVETFVKNNWPTD